jgi:hypothetical protein
MNRRHPKMVYFARCVDGTGPIKIGCSAWPRIRVKELSGIFKAKLELLAVVPGGFTGEHNVHLKFASDGLGREWFTASAELLVFIDQAKTTGKLPFPTDERREEIFAERYLAGETLQAIASDYGLTRERVRQVLRSHGVPSLGHRARPWPAWLTERIALRDAA